MNLFEVFGKLVLSKNKAESIKQKLIYADFKSNPYKWVGMHLVIGLIILSVVGYVSYVNFGLMYFIGISAICVMAYYFISTGIVSLYTEQRARFIETSLPDLLLIMAANVRSGLPTDEALILSARPEFGFLAERIKKSGKAIASGEPVAEALEQVPKNINSPLLEQTIELINEGINSGGELATLLESIANDIRNTALINKEVRSIIFVYAAFISIAVVLIAPVLYAVSVQLASILTGLTQSLAFEFMSKQAVAVQLRPTELSSNFLFNFALVNLVIISVFGSLMIALINKGDQKYGLRYIPVVLTISLVLFYLARIVLQSFFGAIRVL
ncbi:MAG TPA: hypothetical protein ENN30_00655 [Candidatus Woesearchaeota archaeon]|nr:hypothetical protein [Candidatus Woesearchaeota archaeon]